jgi:exodeoxyribonuclease X
MTIPAILVDTETTGFKAPEIIEMAWVEIAETSLERVDYIRCERYRPEGQIEFGAVATHHILPSELTFCPVYTKEELPDHTYLIGHNVDFDWERLGKPPSKRICTLAMSRRLWPELDSHSLTAMFYFIRGVNALTRDVVKNAHSALHDVAITHQLLRHIAEKINLYTFPELYAFSEQARIPTHMAFGKHKGKPIAEVDKGWIAWYRKQDDTDPYLLMAFSKAGK